MTLNDFKLSNSVILSAAFISLSTSASNGAVFTYDVETNIGASGTLLSSNQDNWTGGDIPGWKAQAQGAATYLRNNNAGDDTITRDNDTNFGFTIDPTTTVLSLTMEARIDSFWQAGIANSSNDKLILLGGDFNNSNDFFALTGFQRLSTDNNLATTAAVGGNIASLQLVFDLPTSTFDLIYDPAGAATILQDDIDYSSNLTNADILGMNQLYTRANNQFSGSGTWTIETNASAVPEPSSTALLGLGGLALILRRRR